VECAYYEPGVCRSCSLLPTPYDVQLDSKCAHAASLISPGEWLEPVRSAPWGFRNKAKMVVGGTVDAPTLGILDGAGAGVDLQECPLYPPAIAQAFGPLAEFITRAGLVPYDVPSRRGELKFVLVTGNDAGELMVRFVMRSTESLARIRKHLPALQRELPAMVAASVNLLPEHRAVTEGESELALTDAQFLTMAVNGIPLGLRPQSFFQTNTEIAAALYRQARSWIDATAPRSLWDLYCGVGGFALHSLAAGRAVTGIESSEQAVSAASEIAAHLASIGAPGAQEARFIAADATAFALASDSAPDAVVVNPPRRGIGEELARWLDASGVETVVYSSCNTESLARDLAWMPGFEVSEARVLDMFPHTPHYEVAALLRKR
jgi:23S rRNA (uracil747-C5)-methyltransferase